MRKIIFIGQSGDKAVYYNTRTREALVADKSVLLNTEGARKKRRNNRFHTYAIETLFGAWVGTVVDDVLSTTYDKN